MYIAASKCTDPNFDPMLAATSDDYWFSYDGCKDLSCPHHGEAHKLDPNHHHY